MVDIDKLNELTPREAAAVWHLAYGPKTTDKAIGAALGLSPRTIELYLSTARDKTGTRNRIELMRWGRENLEPELVETNQAG